MSVSPPRAFLFSIVATLIGWGCSDDTQTKEGAPFSVEEPDMTTASTDQARGDADAAPVDDASPPPPRPDAAPDQRPSPDDGLPPEPPPDELGGDRPAPYYVPTGYDGQTSMPVLVVMHGFTGTGSGTVQWWQMISAADRAGVFLIVPEGTQDLDGNPFWNATDFCCDFYRSNVDDVGYITGLVEEAARYFAIDAQRVYLMGHSNGGFMSHRIACDRSDFVAGIVNVAGATWFDAAQCGDPDPVSVLQVHGTWDTVIYYDGVPQQRGDANADPINSEECLNDECAESYGNCLNNPGCNTMVSCFGDCTDAMADTSCYETCFNDGSPTAQFLWMEAWTCGLNRGCYRDPTRSSPGYAGALEGAERWARINGCESETTSLDNLDLVNNPDAETLVTSHRGCPDGVATDVWTIPYGSHGPNFNDNWAPAVLDWLLKQEKTQ